MNAPELSAAELKVEIDRILRTMPTRAPRCIAFFGRTDCTSLRSDNHGDVAVRAVDSEFGLRRALPDVHDDLSFTAFLVSWPLGKIPDDLMWRFMHEGKVHRIGKVERLRQLLGGGLIVVDPSLARAKLANLLLAQGPSVGARMSSGRVTKDAAYEHWLAAAWGCGASSSLGLDSLLAWAATCGRATEFVALMQRPEAQGVAEELADFLRRRLGEPAVRVWELWTQGKGRTLFEFAVLFEALVDGDGTGPVAAVRTASKHALGLAGEAFEAAWRPLGRAVDSALRELERTSDATFVRQVIAAAEAHLDDGEQAMLVASRRLPRAWSLRLDALGGTLAAAASQPTVAAVEQARADLLELDRHAHSRENNLRMTLEAAEMATRLLAWLVARPDERMPRPRHAYADAEALAQWYVHEGGYVDWARQRARGAGDSAFGRGVARVLERVDAVRVDQDRRFAQGLLAWLDERPNHGPMVPIHQAVDRFAANFLAGDPERKVLVLLLDGMAWAQAVSILESLDGGTDPWAPVAWNLDVIGPGPRFFTPVLASLPSVTSISRSAFFAGKAMQPGKDHSASGNPKHWGEHASLTKYFAHGEGGKTLLLRGDGFKADGFAAPEAVSLVRDPSRRIVALVINAIDETLKADTQAQGVWTADQIGPLRELLSAARQAERAVLIASDHGHVSGQRLQWTGFKSGSGSSRWRPWREGDVVHEYEVAVPYGHGWAPAGDGIRGVICLADDVHSYNSGSHYGEHGGATLAEVLAPTFMIASESATLGGAGVPDRALELRRARPPDWWHLDVRTPVRSATPEPAVAAKPSAKTRKTIEQEQLGQVSIAPALADVPPDPLAATVDPAIPTTVPAAAVPPAISGATRALLDRLGRSPVFQARTEREARRQQTLEAVSFLLERSDHAPAPLFAAHLQQPAFRVTGLVANLSEVLNIDGYEVVTYDAVAKQVTLNREQLKLGFGL